MTKLTMRNSECRERNAKAGGRGKGRPQIFREKVQGSLGIEPGLEKRGNLGVAEGVRVVVIIREGGNQNVREVAGATGE